MFNYLFANSFTQSFKSIFNYVDNNNHSFDNKDTYNEYYTSDIKTNDLFSTNNNENNNIDIDNNDNYSQHDFKPQFTQCDDLFSRQDNYNLFSDKGSKDGESTIENSHLISDTYLDLNNFHDRSIYEKFNTIKKNFIQITEAKNEFIKHQHEDYLSKFIY